MRTLSKILLIVSIILCGIAGIVVCVSPKLEDLSLDQTQKELVINSSFDLTVRAKPDKIKVADMEVDWSSSNEEVATVDHYGIVKGVGVGNATITGEYKGFKLQCQVEVLPINVQSISLSCDYLAIHPEEIMQMNASVSPSDATYKNVSWVSSNPLVATISDTGLVTGVGVGETTITAIANNGVQATKTIEVKETIEVESISLAINASNPLNLTITNYSISCAFYPANADDKTLSWESSDSDVISVISDGLISVHKDGSATITATTSNGKTDSINLAVPRVEASTIYIASASGSNILQTVELKKGETMQLYVKFFTMPGDPTPTTREIEWSSSDESLVSVDENGVVTAHDTTILLGVTITAKVKGVSGVTDDLLIKVVE